MSKDDNRRMLLEKAMKEHNYQESALLEILHKAQEIYGYLDKELLMDISGSLNLPPSHVFGVATFYSLFKLRKPGEHVVTGCLGTACYVKEVEEIMQAIEREFQVKHPFRIRHLCLTMTSSSGRNGDHVTFYLH